MFVDEVDGVRLFTDIDGFEVVECAVALANDLGDESPILVGRPAEPVAWLEVKLLPDVRRNRDRVALVHRRLGVVGTHISAYPLGTDNNYPGNWICLIATALRCSFDTKAESRSVAALLDDISLYWNKEWYKTDRSLHLGENEWHETTLIYRRKENSEHTDHRQYSVFMSNHGGGFVSEYGDRWEIESGYRSIKRFMAETTSKDFVLRFFYFAFARLLYSIWRSVDLLVQVELTGKYDRSPVVTANSVLTLLKKQTGIG